MLVQRQEREQELNQNIQKISAEKQELHERVQSLSRTLANIETEKSEMERSTVRLEKDKSALKKTLDKVRFNVTPGRAEFVTYPGEYRDREIRDGTVHSQAGEG